MMLIPMVPTSHIEWRERVKQAQETLNQDWLKLSSGARKSYADLLLGFSSDDASFILLDGQLNEMAGLSENWDSYGAPIPAPETIGSARQAIEKIRFSQLLPEIVAPSAEGGVSIYFSSGSQKAFIEFLNEGDVMVARYGKDDEPNVKVLRNGLQDLNDQVLQEIRDHLGTRAGTL
jgi:hypothetical protein